MSLIENNRGLPTLFVYKKNENKLRVICYSNIFMKLNPTLTEAISCSSAFFAPFADYDMVLHLLDKKHYMKLLLSYMYLNKTSLPKLSPKLNCEITKKQFYFADGCLFDTTAIMAGLVGLALESETMNRPLIISCCAKQRSIRLLWQSETQIQSVMFPLPSLFKGYMPKPEKYTNHCKGFYAYKFKHVHVLPQKNIKEMEIDLVIIVLAASISLSSFPINKFENWNHYIHKIETFIPNAIKYFQLKKTLENLVVCFPGGATSAAIVSNISLKHINKLLKPPNVISCTSGGAWGVTLYYAYPDENCINIMKNNIQTNIIQKLPMREWIYSQLKKITFNSSIIETVLIIIPLLKKIKYDWNKFVQLFIGDLSWDIFPQKTRIVITSTLITNISKIDTIKDAKSQSPCTS